MIDSLWSTVSMVVYAIFRSDYERVYVGKTTGTLGRRLAAHLYYAKTGKTGCEALAHAIRKYGAENMLVHVIDWADTEEELNRKEIFWIKELDARRRGYNLTDGGEGATGRAMTEETRQLMSTAVRIGFAAMTETARREMSANNRAAHNCPSTVAKMSASRKIVMACPDARNKIRVARVAYWAHEEGSGRALRSPEERERRRLYAAAWRLRRKMNLLP